MNTQQLLENVEGDLLSAIIENMKHNKITTQEAQQLAKDFLALLPIHDKYDLLKKLKDLGGKYDEAQSVFLKYAKPEEEKDRHEKLVSMAEHIKNGDIDKALGVAKGGNYGG